MSLTKKFLLQNAKILYLILLLEKFSMQLIILISIKALKLSLQEMSYQSKSNLIDHFVINVKYVCLLQPHFDCVIFDLDTIPLVCDIMKEGDAILNTLA